MVLVRELTGPTPIPEHPDCNFSAEKIQTSGGELLVANYRVRLDDGYLFGILRNLTLHPDVSVREDNVSHESTAPIFGILSRNVSLSYQDIGGDYN